MSVRSCCGPGERTLMRGFIDGVALHLAKPHGDLAYFRSAKTALYRLHRAGICHNDLAKEQNWLRGVDGHAISPTSSLPPASARAAGSSASQPMRICATS